MGQRIGGAGTWLMRHASALHGRLWWTRAMTLGVRALVVDGTSVLLVRHTYTPGWYLPGGGVDANESAETAVVRELREEAGIVCAERPALFGFYWNKSFRRRDHVACYVVRSFTREPFTGDWEIAEIGFFPADALPDGTTPATRARLAELFGGAAQRQTW